MFNPIKQFRPYQVKGFSKVDVKVNYIKEKKAPPVIYDDTKYMTRGNGADKHRESRVSPVKIPKA